MDISINHLQHVGIPVTDIATSKLFYESLGFTDVMSTTFELEGEQGKVSMMQLKGMIIELYQMPKSHLEEVRSRSNGHVDHIAFDVDDVDTVFQKLKNAGYRIVEDSPVHLPTFWSKGCRYFMILGPDGERLEFNQIL
jgi:lactoylglutathione lyase